MKNRAPIGLQKQTNTTVYISMTSSSITSSWLIPGNKLYDSLVEKALLLILSLLNSPVRCASDKQYFPQLFVVEEVIEGPTTCYHASLCLHLPLTQRIIT